MIVRTNPRSEMREFYPPPYSFLGPRGMSGSGAVVQGVVTGLSTGASVAAVIPGGQLVAGALALGASITALMDKIFSGCGQSCVLTSQAANQIGDALSQNVQAYINTPVRTKSLQAAYLANFDGAWAKLQQYCGQPSFGTAGKNCIGDREQGACKWKSSPGGWTKNSDGTCTYTGPGAAGSGDACWNYFVGFRDPIANDPCVQPDVVLSQPGVSSALSALLPASSSGLSGLLLPGLLIAVGAAFAFSGGR
jgi:hypothetical protein